MSEDQEEVLDDAGQEQGILSHLVELRDRLLRCVLAVIIVFAALFSFSEEIYTWLADPLLRHLPEGSNMIAIDVASPFLTPFKLVLMLSIAIAIPVLLSQIWGFIAPGLYKSEKRLAVPLLVSSTILFYLGAAFAYFVVFPLIFGFFTAIAPVGVEVSTDIARYLDFVITIFFAFGIAFEVPVAVFLLIAIGATTPESLAKKRPYFIVAAFVIGMFLTPPDVISQTLLALPMWLLFEAGILAARLLLKKPEEKGKHIAPVSPPPSAPLPAAAPVAPQAPEPEFEPQKPYAERDLEAEAAEKAARDAAQEAEVIKDTQNTSDALTDEELEAELDAYEAQYLDHSDAGLDDEPIDTREPTSAEFVPPVVGNASQPAADDMPDPMADMILEEDMEDEIERLAAEEDGEVSETNPPSASDEEIPEDLDEPLSEEQIAEELARIKRDTE